MTTNRTYRSWIFALFYFGVLLLGIVPWFFLTTLPAWLAAIPVGFGVLGLPWLRANLIIDEEGITQQIFQTRSAKWADIISWQRTNSGMDGPDTITIVTRSGSFTLNHNLVFGERVDFIDAELRRRRVPIAGFTES